MTDQSVDEWLTCAQAVRLLPEVNVRQLQRWAAMGLVPASRLPNGHLRFRRRDVVAALHPVCDEEASAS
jgi:DNA-binding transcriptional MerR regulator